MLLLQENIYYITVQTNYPLFLKSLSLNTFASERKFALTVDGSYEGTQTHTLSSCLCPTSPARFHYIKYNQAALTVALPRRRRLSRVCEHM